MVSNRTISAVSSMWEVPSICKGGTPLLLGGEGGGIVLPLGGNWEAELSQSAQVMLYGTGLLYCFLGISIISDVFMASIEKITSAKTKVNGKTQKVWNDTIANLTLMALGSSAPEIMLSLIELIGGGMHSGELGPSTIVGSAAFNLLIITGVVVSAIPSGESRKIKDVSVFAVTASFSIFAYLWLLFILRDHVVTIIEGIITLAWFGVLLVVAYIADRGYLHRVCGRQKEQPLHFSEHSSSEDIGRMLEKLKMKLGALPEEPESQAKLMQIHFSKPPSRAARRLQTGIRSVMVSNKLSRSVRDVQKKVGTEVDEEIGSITPSRAWYSPSAETAAAVSTKAATQQKLKTPPAPMLLGNSQVFDATEAALAQLPDSLMCSLSPAHDLPEKVLVNVPNGMSLSPAHDLPEKVLVNAPHGISLSRPTSGPAPPVAIPDPIAPIADSSKAINACSGNSQGILAFDKDELRVDAASFDKEHQIVVRRRGCSSGIVSCTCRTEDITAIKGKDYGELSEMLTFESGQTEAELNVLVLANTRFEKTESFRIILEEPSHPGLFDATTDGGKMQNILTVVIVAENKKHGWEELMSTINWDQCELGQIRWHEQIIDAVFDVQPEAGVLEWFLHIVSVPWKLLCALVPPPEFCGGWLCFFSALVLIGICTAVVGDMANLFGCALDIKAPLVAVTFVALGTSLPDTFASKTAAVQDQYADSSIGNITGSNSVNVFLGLGLPWLIGAIYWKIQGADDTNQANDPWYKQGARVNWPAEVFHHHPNGAFVVPAGSLVFTVGVFVACAACCIGILILRRCVGQGELGGDKRTAYATSAGLALLWAFYIGMNCLQLQVTEGGIMGF